MASSSVANALGCDGWRDSRAFKIVSWLPVIAITLVSRGPGEMPIDRLLIGCLLARGHRLLDGERDRALGDRRREGNFLATRVRHYLTAGGAGGAPPAPPGTPSVRALPGALLPVAAGRCAAQAGALRRAGDRA